MIISRLKSKSFLLPTLLWLLFLLSFLILMQTSHTKFDSLLRTLIQWDGRHYLSIARDGYEVYPCGWDPTYICGNAGWFPMYPLTASLLSRVGLEHRYALLAVSWLSLWLALLVLYRLVERRFGDRVALVSLICLLLFPGSFYYLTAFPYALYLLLAVMALYLLDTGQYRWLALPCAVLAVTYPSGVVVAMPVLWVLLTRFRQLSRADKISLAAAPIAMGLALLTYCLYYYWRFDNFFLYFTIQSQSYYAHEPTFPLWTIARSLIDLPWNSPVALILLLVVATAGLFYTKKLPGPWQVYMFSLLLFTPTAGTTDCYYRHIVVAFPLFVMVALTDTGSRRKWLLPVYVVVCLVLIFSVYLPAYKAGVLM